MKPNGPAWNCPIRPNRGWGTNGGIGCRIAGTSVKCGRPLSPSEDAPHLVAAIDRVVRGLGGVSRWGGFTGWPPSATPGVGPRSPPLPGVATPYGFSVAICPPRRGQPQGLVEKVTHTAEQRGFAPWPTSLDGDSPTVLRDHNSAADNLRLATTGTRPATTLTAAHR